MAREKSVQASISPQEQIADAVYQWPESPQDRMRAMDERLSRVFLEVNAAAGRQILGRLGHTGQAAVAEADGTITVDLDMLWGLSEDALAALVAHEVADVILALPKRMQHSLVEERSPEVSQRTWAMEATADRIAGELIGRTPYRAEGFDELLRQTAHTKWSPARDRPGYPDQRRSTVFREGFTRSRSRQPKSEGSQERLAVEPPASRPAQES